jgi:hypothetical protein
LIPGDAGVFNIFIYVAKGCLCQVAEGQPGFEEENQFCGQKLAEIVL